MLENQNLLKIYFVFFILYSAAVLATPQKYFLLSDMEGL